MNKLDITVVYGSSEESERAAAEKPYELVSEQVETALTELGHTVRRLAVTSDINTTVKALSEDQSNLIFNVCESVDGGSGQDDNFAGLLELMRKPFTGSGLLGHALAQDKALSKKLFSFHGLLYPKFSVIEAGQVDWADELKFPLFIKPANEDASVGIDGDAIVRNIKQLMERISFIHTEIGCPVLIEEFIDGREMYVGILGNEKPEPLPIIEWDFSKLPKDVPRIATAEAKWNEESSAFRAPAVFPEDLPEPVYKRIQEVALTAYRAVKLSDYGRVDLRVRRVGEGKEGGRGGSKKSVAADDENPDNWEIYVIEMNPNPYLERSAELALSAVQAGLDYPQFIERIVELALKRTA